MSTSTEERYFPGNVKLRWFNANCYEIKLPNGKTIITDPFIPAKDHPMEKWHKYYRGFDIEDLEGGDYAVISHPHADHLGSLPELFDRFAGRVLCHSSYAIRLTMDLRIPQQMIFPMENDRRYEFDDFIIDTVVARHGPGDVKARPAKNRIIDGGTEWEYMNMLGALFNTNFIITTRNNIRIAFCEGDYDCVEKNCWKNAGINLLLRQCGMIDQDPELHIKAAETFMSTGAEIMMPIHHEKFTYEEMSAFAEKVNGYLREKNYPGQMVNPECGKWYSLGMAVQRG